MKKVLLIGATSSIAQAVAHEWAREGAVLHLLARSEPKLALVAADLKARHGATVTFAAFDFDDLTLHEGALQGAIASLQGLDAALICHGTLSDQEACATDFVLAEREFHTNLLSPLSFLTHLANHFEKRGHGCLAAISSVAGDRGRKSNYVYGTAKAGLATFLEGLRHRFGRTDVHVLTIKPGFVDTPMTAHLRKGLLFAAPEKVARDIVRAMKGRPSVLYTPWFWRWIMLIIRLIPDRVFNRSNL